jgi:hypothetical protein
MFKRFYTIILFSILFSNSDAQRTYPVLSSYAFYQINMPGFNKMDESGNSLSTIDTTFFIYLLIKGNVEPKIDKVVFNQFVYLASVFKIDDKSIDVGKLKTTNKLIRFNVERGQTLWKIELQKQNSNSIIRTKEYNKFRVVFQKNLHWRSFEIQAGLELQPEEHN